ncbi:MAG: biotin--[acetyl-CoA-carboxylase] ligase [Candidatus Brocadiaceae bacterium]|nr:biotin--[acetyl-CoA-carboxylase] ligase [Candidatus Brocadiaceae bacterium]
MNRTIMKSTSSQTDEQDHLIPGEITKGLKTKVVGSSIITYERTTSTMDIAKKLARTHFKNGTVIFSEEQTKGRGRSGHSWFCPRKKGLLFTLLLKLKIPPDHICLLTGTIAVSLTETLRESVQVGAEIKWPNDILISGKKVGGVLVDLEKETEGQLSCLIGVGININNDANELPKQVRLPATSLAIEKKRVLNRTLLARAFLQDIDKWYLILKDEHFGYITKKWKEYCVTIGKKTSISDYDREYTGEVIDISNNGGLMVKLPDGQIKIFRGEHATIKYE